MSEKHLFNQDKSGHGLKEVGKEFNHGPWHIEYRLNDGGRLSRISYKDYDLLTVEPTNFCPPTTDYGQYERRPVFGYDDCFPSLGSCCFPGTKIYIPDHGEICWLTWELLEKPRSLEFFVKSKILPLAFKRKMVFTDSSIIWNFEVFNESHARLPFQHVMHPLYQLDKIKSIELPEFQSAFDWIKGQNMNSLSPGKMRELLLGQPLGSARMLYLRNIKTGELSWTYFNRMCLKVKFPLKFFPTIGIWWNNSGYPEQDGICRTECSFEPTAGFSGILSQGYEDGNCMSVDPGGFFSWQIRWEMEIN
ncbi:MAG: hypothetical protein WAO19_08470 [Candidatus Kryptoniota bacterium]